MNRGLARGAFQLEEGESQSIFDALLADVNRISRTDDGTLEFTPRAIAYDVGGMAALAIAIQLRET